MKRILISLCIFLFSFSLIQGTFAADVSSDKNLNTGNITSGTNRANDTLKHLSTDSDYSIWKGGVVWVKNTLVKIADSMKDILFIIATVYFLILVIRLLFASNTEEEIWNFKKWILWISIWLVITQIAYSFVDTFYDQWVSWWLAWNFIANIINPLIEMMETLASAFFVAMAIFTFYRMVTANWEDDKVTKWKQSIIYAIIWFIIVKLAKVLVVTTYWKIDCWSKVIKTSCVREENLEWFTLIIVDVINWMNSFIGIIVVLMIIYAGFQILLSAWDEEKVSKAKKSIIWVFIGLVILTTNFLILTFFLVPESAI